MNKTTNAGRHSVGQKMARPGSIRPGQGAHTSGLNPGAGHNPKTGVSRSSPSRMMTPRPGVAANQADTSRDLMKRLTGKAPQPFTNEGGAATMKVPTHPQFRSTGAAKELNYEISNRKSIHNGTKMSAEEMAAVGYGPNDTMSSESIISGNPTRGNERQAGKPGTRSKNASRREQAAVRQSPIKLY